ncbi:MAG: GGDEF domain-containing protein [Actinomycetota bacterium]|nr:GGDEF domain-containing protein [Actinomycetota bacterium]
MTGLYNRAAFGEQLDRALSFAKRNQGSLALLLLDLDNFKRVNDTLGHSVGDRLLVEVADRLRSCVRTEDIVARLGGDEFCALLENLADIEGAVRAAERIKACLEEPFVLGAHRLPRLTASVGVVLKAPVNPGPPSGY